MSQSCCGVGGVWRSLLPLGRSLAQSVSGSLARSLSLFETFGGDPLADQWGWRREIAVS